MAGCAPRALLALLIGDVESASEADAGAEQLAQELRSAGFDVNIATCPGALNSAHALGTTAMADGPRLQDKLREYNSCIATRQCAPLLKDLTVECAGHLGQPLWRAALALEGGYEYEAVFDFVVMMDAMATVGDQAVGMHTRALRGKPVIVVGDEEHSACLCACMCAHLSLASTAPADSAAGADALDAACAVALLNEGQGVRLTPSLAQLSTAAPTALSGPALLDRARQRALRAALQPYYTLSPPGLVDRALRAPTKRRFWALVKGKAERIVRRAGGPPSRGNPDTAAQPAAHSASLSAHSSAPSQGPTSAASSATLHLSSCDAPSVVVWAPSPSDPRVLPFLDAELRAALVGGTWEAAEAAPAAGFLHGWQSALVLYRGMVHPDAPGLVFIGLQSHASSSPRVLELQVRWAAAHLLGRLQLPAVANMRADIARQRSWREASLTSPLMSTHGSLASAHERHYAAQLKADLEGATEGEGVRHPMPTVAAGRATAMEDAEGLQARVAQAHGGTRGHKARERHSEAGGAASQDRSSWSSGLQALRKALQGLAPTSRAGSSRLHRLRSTGGEDSSGSLHGRSVEPASSLPRLARPSAPQEQEPPGGSASLGRLTLQTPRYQHARRASTGASSLASGLMEVGQLRSSCSSELADCDCIASATEPEASAPNALPALAEGDAKKRMDCLGATAVPPSYATEESRASLHPEAAGDMGEDPSSASNLYGVGSPGASAPLMMMWMQSAPLPAMLQERAREGPAGMGPDSVATWVRMAPPLPVPPTPTLPAGGGAPPLNVRHEQAPLPVGAGADCGGGDGGAPAVSQSESLLGIRLPPRCDVGSGSGAARSDRRTPLLRRLTTSRLRPQPEGDGARHELKHSSTSSLLSTSAPGDGDRSSAVGVMAAQLAALRAHLQSPTANPFPDVHSGGAAAADSPQGRARPAPQRHTPPAPVEVDRTSTPVFAQRPDRPSPRSDRDGSGHVASGRGGGGARKPLSRMWRATSMSNLPDADMEPPPPLPARGVLPTAVQAASAASTSAAAAAPHAEMSLERLMCSNPDVARYSITGTVPEDGPVEFEEEPAEGGFLSAPLAKLTRALQSARGASPLGTPGDGRASGGGLPRAGSRVSELLSAPCNVEVGDGAASAPLSSPRSSAAAFGAGERRRSVLLIRNGHSHNHLPSLAGASDLGTGAGGTLERRSDGRASHGGHGGDAATSVRDSQERSRWGSRTPSGAFGGSDGGDSSGSVRAAAESVLGAVFGGRARAAARATAHTSGSNLLSLAADAAAVPYRQKRGLSAASTATATLEAASLGSPCAGARDSLRRSCTTANLDEMQGGSSGGRPCRDGGGAASLISGSVVGPFQARATHSCNGAPPACSAVTRRAPVVPAPRTEDRRRQTTTAVPSGSAHQGRDSYDGWQSYIASAAVSRQSSTVDDAGSQRVQAPRAPPHGAAGSAVPLPCVPPLTVQSLVQAEAQARAQMMSSPGSTSPALMVRRASEAKQERAVQEVSAWLREALMTSRGGDGVETLSD